MQIRLGQKRSCNIGRTATVEVLQQQRSYIIGVPAMVNEGLETEEMGLE